MIDAAISRSLETLLARFAQKQQSIRTERYLGGDLPAGRSALQLLCTSQLRQLMNIVRDLEGGRSAVRDALLRQRDFVRTLSHSHLFARALQSRNELTLLELLMGPQALSEHSTSDAYGAALDQCVRGLQWARSLSAAIAALGARVAAIKDGDVLSLYCAGASEMRSLPVERPPFRLTMLDSNAENVSANRSALMHLGAVHAQAGIVDLIEGRGCFSLLEKERDTLVDLGGKSFTLIYSPDVLNRLRHVPGDLDRGTSGLTSRLAGRLRIGGRLLLGAWLNADPEGTDAFMIEAILGCTHVARSALEILSFSDGLHRDAFTVRLLDGGLDGPITPGSTFCWLEIRRVT